MRIECLLILLLNLLGLYLSCYFLEFYPRILLSIMQDNINSLIYTVEYKDDCSLCFLSTLHFTSSFNFFNGISTINL